MKINTRKIIKIGGGTIRFRRLDGPAARAVGIDYRATYCKRYGGGINDAERVNGVWRGDNELVQILNSMEAP